MLAAELGGAASIEQLLLGANEIGAAGAKSIAALLRKMRKLKALHIGANALGGADRLQSSGARAHARACVYACVRAPLVCQVCTA